MTRLQVSGMQTGSVIFDWRRPCIFFSNAKLTIKNQTTKFYTQKIHVQAVFFMFFLYLINRITQLFSYLIWIIKVLFVILHTRTEQSQVWQCDDALVIYDWHQKVLSSFFRNVAVSMMDMDNNDWCSWLGLLYPDVFGA